MLRIYCNHSTEWDIILFNSSLNILKNNLRIGWLWNLDRQATSDESFVHLLLTFLQHPKRCGHLSIGNFSTIGHFAHLCAQIILNSHSPFNLRYLPFLSFFFYWIYIWHAYASYLYCLHEMLPMLLKNYHSCSYRNDIGKCIKVSETYNICCMD